MTKWIWRPPTGGWQRLPFFPYDRKELTMDIVERLKILVTDLDVRSDERPDCEETSELDTIAAELLDWARELSAAQAEVEHAHYKLELLADDNADLIEICRLSLEGLRCGDPDAVLDAVSLLEAAYSVGDHAGTELDEEREPEDPDPPHTFAIKSALDEDV